MAEPATGSVAHRASRALGWSFLNTIVSRLGTLAIGVVLARVLGPGEFGVFAIATVTLLAVLSFNELGVSLAIVRWPDDPARIAPTVNSVSVASSGLLTLLVIGLAPWISAGLGDVRATPVVQVMAVSILVNGLVATPAAVLQREFLQKQRTIADQVNAWLGAFVSLGLALAGMGAMSLAVGRIAGSLASAVLLLRWSPIRYGFGWDRDLLPRLLRFGVPLAAASVVVFASGYADQVLVGSRLGAQALGFYVLAFNLASWPVSIFSQPLRAVAPAAFAKVQDDPERLARAFLRVLRVLSLVAVPACLAISGAAAPVIGFVYGEQWLPAGDVLVFLAALAAARIWFELVYDYLVVLGRSGSVLVIQLLWFAAAVPAMLLGIATLGAPGAALAQLAVVLLVVLPAYLVVLRRSGIALLGAAGAVAVPVLAGAVVWIACRLISDATSQPVLASVASGLLAVAVIAALAWWRRDELTSLRRVAGGASG
jgi:PST family polysaccharide transporter